MNDHDKADYLESHRFRISDASSSLLHNLRRGLPEIQTSLPVVLGYGFYGSRTVGKEQSESEIQAGKKPSDLDITVFYDGSEYYHSSWSLTPDQNALPPLAFKNGSLGIDEVEVASQIKKNRERLWMTQQITERVATQITQITQIPDQEFSVHCIDICPGALKAYINTFRYKSDVWEVAQKGSVSPDKPVDGDMMSLVLLFSLSVGPGVYDARKFVLDTLAKTNIGELLCKVLLQYVVHWERSKDTIEKKRKNSVPYKMKFPETIEEARKYFL